MTTLQQHQTQSELFAEKALANITGLLVTLMAGIGDRLGLFSVLAQEPVTCAELATRAQINERYAREWLNAMTCAGYIEYDPVTACFVLPAAHIPVLAQEGSVLSMSGMHQETIGVVSIIPQLLTAFRVGGGVSMDAYSADVWEGMARLSHSWFEHFLVQQWIPALPAVQEMLLRGVHVADVGCGQGRALIKLAQAFPLSRFTGYDIFAPLVEAATANAQAAGVADRVSFRQLDVSEGLPQQYDIITTFDMVHDAPDPRKLLCAIRQGLQPQGRYVCVEISCSEKLEENIGMRGALLYSSSVLYCMTTSLALGGAGLGTAGMPERLLRELCTEAGFSDVRRASIEDRFNALYAIIP
jgi:2-polyprenyl-3-methyl-5-hydroxy-6-metoxy-1,4-benzoquinol methylase